ncbi:MAG TPA: MFS transporter [Candidatus Sulfotelmatobacter sp.]|nr:MFS transporter [Candidatus Sulfotelmatobacter sp.]
MSAGLSGRRNALVLAICQALYTSSISVDLTLTGLVGYSLAADKALATLPFSLITIAAATTTVFAAFLMSHVGRRRAFMLGAGVGAMGGLISVWSILHQSFWGFCCGTATVGVFQAFAGYYRLAAADAVGLADKSRAISTVMTGGVIAAVAGPAIAAWSKDLLSPVLFAGSYLVVTVFGLVSILLLAFLFRDSAPVPAAGSAVASPAPRPLGRIVRQPIFIAALANNVVGYAVMMFIMTATPIAAVACHHTIDDGANIIQWHLVGMFAPAFVTGRLIDRYGAAPILLAGVLLSAACTGIALAATGLLNFYLALLALGIGWNFMYVGGTSLLTRSYTPTERAKTQATSEFSTFGATALASLCAGQLLTRYGWAAINTAILPLLAFAAGMTLWWLLAERRRAAALAA